MQNTIDPTGSPVAKDRRQACGTRNEVWDLFAKLQAHVWDGLATLGYIYRPVHACAVGFEMADREGVGREEESLRQQKEVGECQAVDLRASASAQLFGACSSPRS